MFVCHQLADVQGPETSQKVSPVGMAATETSALQTQCKLLMRPEAVVLRAYVSCVISVSIVCAQAAAFGAVKQLPSR
jgi:hypothetical protein